MAQKFFYVVDHYVPFPSSEYGGVWNVVAMDDEECFDLITAEDDGNWNSEYYSNLRENVIKAYKFALADDAESTVVMEFTT
jgi:hypothetical protein